MIINAYRFAGGGGGGGTEYGMPTYSTIDGSGFAGTDRLGWLFTPNEDLNLTGLRVNLNLSGAVPGENVRVHRLSDGVLIAEATIVPTVGLEWEEGAVTPVTLSSGVDYVVSGREVDGSSRGVIRNNTFTYNSRITAAATGSLFGPDNNIPASVSGNTYRHVDIVIEV